MFRKNLNKGILAGITVLSISLFSCKENIYIKSDLTPSNDNIQTVVFDIPDSCLNAISVPDDSIQTSTASVSYNVYHALGFMQEPSSTTLPYPTSLNGDVIFQVVPTSTGFNFATGDVLDSLIIVLPYSGFSWGDTTLNDAQTITAYEMKDSLSVKTPYYNYTDKQYQATPIGSTTFYTGVKGTGVIGDSVQLPKYKVVPHLRIKLTDDFKTRFQTLIAKQYSSQDSFLLDLKGFYLKSNATGAGRAMPYFRINGSSSYYTHANLLAYMHNGTNDSLIYQFPFNTTYTAHYNKVNRTYGDKSIFNANHPNLMVQNQPGAAIDLFIKNLRTFKELQGAVVINQASLILTEINEYKQTDKYVRLDRTYPYGIDFGQNKYRILDLFTSGAASESGLSFIDGTPRTDTVSKDVTYTINFPRELQQCIIQQKSELHLRINGTSSYLGAYRLVVGNKNNPNTRYRYALKVTYSKQK